MSSETLRSELTHNGQAARVTLCNPPSNVMNLQMMEEVNTALLSLRNKSGLKVLVIQGEGDAFCTGVDLTEHTPDKVSRTLQLFHRIFETIRLLDVVSVSAVNGLAVGGGFELAMSCNLVVASESSRFSLPEVSRGVFPPVACVILPRAAPRRKAMEWILLGQELTATELAAFGLVSRVLPDDGFDRHLDEFLGLVTANSGSVLQLARRAQTETYNSTYEEALHRVENLYLRELMALDDPHEGVAAFIEGREPKWRNA